MQKTRGKRDLSRVRSQYRHAHARTHCSVSVRHRECRRFAGLSVLNSAPLPSRRGWRSSECRRVTALGMNMTQSQRGTDRTAAVAHASTPRSQSARSETRPSDHWASPPEQRGGSSWSGHDLNPAPDSRLEGQIR
jgi:hypothetical protein